MSGRRIIGVVTVGRSDYGIYRPVLLRLANDARFELRIFAGGMHLSARYGETWRVIERDGFTVTAKAGADGGDPAGSPSDVAAAMGAGLAAYARIYTSHRPDLLLVLGDRYEMFAAAAASIPFRIPLAHIHGGETTEGAIDESFRHAITKMSHLHFVSNAAHAARVRQMGEEPWRITVSGAPALDAIRDFQPLKKETLAERIGIEFSSPPLLVTYHPATLADMPPDQQIAELLAGLSAWNGDIVFTGVNADTGHPAIRDAVSAFLVNHASARRVESLGTEAYFSLMSYAAAMVGNSSSGLIEAPSFGLPVVNVGPRQQGRVRAPNVLDTPCQSSAISEAIACATSAEFRRRLRGLVNPYGDGHAAERIVNRLAEVDLDCRLVMKKFLDLPSV